MRDGSKLFGAATYQSILIGGGGFVIDVDSSAASGRRVIACDIAPGQWLNETTGKWQDMLTGVNIAGLTLATGMDGIHYSGNGSYAAAISDSDPNVMMLSYQGNLLRTTDAWETAHKCNMTPKKMRSNDSFQRTWQHKLAIHPTNPLIWLLGTQLDNVWYSLDGGATCANIGLAPPKPATSTLAGGVNASGTSLALLSGANFPAPSGGKFFLATLTDGTENYDTIYPETVKVTALSGNTLTVVRGYANSTARSFASGATATLSLGWNGSASPHIVAFDPGNPNYCYASDPNIPGMQSGIWRSTTGPGGAWSLVAGGPLVPSNIHVCANGDVLVVDARETFLTSGEPRLWKLARGGSTWSELAAPHPGLHCLVSNPSDVNHWITAGNDQFHSFTYDGGATYTQFGNNERIEATNSLHWLETGTIFSAALDFNAVDGRVYLAHGRGVLRATPKASGDTSKWVWEEYSQGNEMLGSPDIFSDVGIEPLALFLDKPIMRIAHVNAPSGQPIIPGYDNDPGTIVTHGWCIDNEPGNPQNLVALINYGGGHFSGFNENGGIGRWEQFEDPTIAGTPNGGCIIRTGPSQLIVCPGNNGPMKRTTDFGATWSDLSIGGISPVDNQNNMLWLNRHNIASDKQRPGHAVFLGRNNDPPQPLAGVWKTEDHGVTWVQKFVGVVDPDGPPAQFWDCKIAYIPGHAGKLLYTVGQSDAPTSKFRRSDDDGATWSWVRSGVYGVRWFGFGRGLSDHPWPAVIYSARTGTSFSDPVAIYGSWDMFATDPIMLVPPDHLPITGLKVINGDMNVLGRIWISTNSGGIGYFDFKDVRALT